VLALVKGFTKELFHALGLEIQRVPPFRAYEWLRGENIRTIFDVGANTGQFARCIHLILPESLIYSFEPLPQCHEQLVMSMGRVPQFRAFRFALSDECGSAPMYHNKFSPSSSLLPMEHLHQEAFPYTRQADTEWVEVKRLDDFVDDLKIVDNVLVKIDVQGLEDKVIRGGERMVSRASVLILETAFRPLYTGQPLFETIYDILRAKGFVFMGCESPMRNPRDGRILQCDSIFVRRDGRKALAVVPGN